LVDEAGNLERFLSSTTPSVPVQYLPKVRILRICSLVKYCVRLWCYGLQCVQGIGFRRIVLAEYKDVHIWIFTYGLQRVCFVVHWGKFASPNYKWNLAIFLYLVSRLRIPVKSDITWMTNS
jgi:hypothetical protein